MWGPEICNRHVRARLAAAFSDGDIFDEAAAAQAEAEKADGDAEFGSYEVNNDNGVHEVCWLNLSHQKLSTEQLRSLLPTLAQASLTCFCFFLLSASAVNCNVKL